MHSRSVFAAVIASLFTYANGHMTMRSPVPYGVDTLNNSPLETSGSDFPCKQRAGVYDVSTMNSMAVDSPQTLAFQGGATHGGGSCQVSITLDQEPTADSTWKVIHSIIGGCPINSDGNLSGNPTDEGSDTFEFSIPNGVPNGQYTLAWTWFNKIGNREMYMNCAPIDVSGSDEDESFFDSLPDMFVANLPPDQCHTPESENFVFPDPG
ncbi:hypothetical protein BDY21DRAFT_289260, partial [Lineolata rhizophorae]